MVVIKDFLKLILHFHLQYEGLLGGDIDRADTPPAGQ
jgi:hypothetical protein